MAMQLTSDEVAKLSDQELDTYVRVVLNESRSRRDFLDKANNYRGRQVIPGMILFLLAGVSFVFSNIGWVIPALVFACMALMQWHAAGLNRRIDALMNLLDLESAADSASLHGNTESIPESQH